MPKTDLEIILADLRKQREDLDRRIHEIERGDSTAEILDRLRKWRERAEQTAQEPLGDEDETLKMRR